MHYDELRSLIREASKDETVETIDKAVQVMELYEANGYMLVYETALGEVTELDGQSCIDRIKSDTYVMINELLAMQGITIKEECLLSDVVELARATFESVYYEDKETLKAIIMAGEDSLDTYVQITSLSSTLEAERMFEIVEKVNEDYPSNFLYMLNKDEDEEGEENTEEAIKSVEAYKKFIEAYPGEYFAHQYIFNINTIGLESTFYINQYKKSSDYLSVQNKESIEKAAKELSLFRILCSDKDQFLKNMSDFYPNPIDQTALVVALNRLKAE